MERNQLIAIIHVARNNARECPSCGALAYQYACPSCGTPMIKLRDERYREILEKFGARSCSNLMNPELEKVYELFKRAGFVPKEDPVKARHERGRKQTIAIIQQAAWRLFADEWQKRVNGFIKKTCNKDSLWKLDDKELRQVIGWLNRYKKYMEKRNDEKRN